MRMRVFGPIAAVLLMSGSAYADPGSDDRLGTVHFATSCGAVQAKFERAVALLHNFHYPEHLKAFQAIAKEDPDCAIAYWGIAISEMPNPLVPPFPRSEEHTSELQSPYVIS